MCGLMMTSARNGCKEQRCLPESKLAQAVLAAGAAAGAAAKKSANRSGCFGAAGWATTAVAACTEPKAKDGAAAGAVAAGAGAAAAASV